MNIKSIAGRVLRKPESATEDDAKALDALVLKALVDSQYYKERYWIRDERTNQSWIAESLEG